MGALLFAVISLLAIGITLRHRDLFNEKMDAIRKLEKLLYAPDLFQKRKDLKSRLFKVQYFLIVLYFVFFCFFVYIGVFGTDTVP